MRPSADALVEAVLVLSTLGAPERRRFRRRRPEAVTEAEPEPVPTSRATIVRSSPFASAEEAADWLAGLRSGSAGDRGGESAGGRGDAPAGRRGDAPAGDRGDASGLDSEVDAAVAVLNRALRAHRAAAADPYVAEVSASRALVVRVGYGSGEEVADGRYVEAYELPRGATRRARRSMEAPEERFAMLLSGRVEALPAEELVLRARADLNAGRPREAALQARVAIEALLAALDDSTEGGAAPAATIASHRDTVAAAANAALRGEVPGDSTAALEEGVAAMELALKRHRLGG